MKIEIEIENHTEDNGDMGDEKEKIGQVPFTGADGHDVLGHMQCERIRRCWCCVCCIRSMLCVYVVCGRSVDV